MATVTAPITGTLSDFGLEPIAGLHPEIEFRPSSAAVGVGGRLLATKPIRVPPNASGAFTANLVPVDDLLPVGVHYKVSVRWLDSGNNFVKADNPDWKLFVPAAGGAIADLIRLPIGTGLVITSPVEPPLWLGIAAKWLQLDPNDPDNPANPANTGDLYELRNV